MTTIYQADTLEDIAKYFDEKSNNAAMAANSARKALEVAENNVAAWAEAARIIRSTSIGPAPDVIEHDPVLLRMAHDVWKREGKMK